MSNKQGIMIFEFLSNEILIECFEYIIFIYTIPCVSNTFIMVPNRIKYCHNLINNVNTFDSVTDLTVYQDALTENCPYYFSNITSLTLKAWYNYPISTLTTKHIEYLKLIVNLFNLKHLNMPDYVYKLESSSVLLEILKKSP